MLRKHNPELNLTRIHNFENMVLKLYVDSILPGRIMKLPSPLLDLGTGPGMPGIPLKIAFPELQIYLAEGRRKRVNFLREVLDALSLSGIEVIGHGITPDFNTPVNGVITRAVEDISATLARVQGCLRKDGLVVFMKGPSCDEEVGIAGIKFKADFILTLNKAYYIPGTPHERRLVVFRRISVPLESRKATAMAKHSFRFLESEKNAVFKDLKKLLGAKGIKKQGRAIVAGAGQVTEVMGLFPQRCLAWISKSDTQPPPEGAPPNMVWYQLAPYLFDELDVFGTARPLLLIRLDDIPVWDPFSPLPEGCSLLVPFQDPENVGAVVRSAVAFGVSKIILLAESAHPYHPKAIRASGGAVLSARFLLGPGVNELPPHLPIVALSAKGRDIAELEFPRSFLLLPGMEGPGLPEAWEHSSTAIPIRPEVESLNAAAATAVALYVWSQRAKC